MDRVAPVLAGPMTLLLMGTNVMQKAINMQQEAVLNLLAMMGIGTRIDILA